MQRWKDANPGYNSNWRKQNKDKVRALRLEHRAKLNNQMTKLDWTDTKAHLIRIENDCCFFCGGPGEEVEHLTPLSRGGTHHWWNLQMACVACNRGPGGKHRQTADEFIPKDPGLVICEI